MTQPDLLVVATHKNWIAQEFAETGYIPVKHNFGVSAPLYPKERSIAWWMPTETASRFLYAGVDLNLATLDAEWLSRVPRGMTGRTIFTMTIQEAILSGYKQHGFCKLAEVKIPDIPAQWIEIDYFTEILLQARVPLDTKIQVSFGLLEIDTEYRCFVNNKEVTTVATYRNKNNIFGQPDFVRDLRGEEWAKDYAKVVSKFMYDDQPISYTLDIAQLSKGRMVVIEANPVWSSNPYDCNKVEVIKAIIEGSTTYNNQKTHGKFQWVLDPYLKQYAESRSKLVLDDYN